MDDNYLFMLGLLVDRRKFDEMDGISRNLISYYENE